DAASVAFSLSDCGVGELVVGVGELGVLLPLAAGSSPPSSAHEVIATSSSTAVATETALRSCVLIRDLSFPPGWRRCRRRPVDGAAWTPSRTIESLRPL